MHRIKSIQDAHGQKASLLVIFAIIIAALYYGQGIFIPLALAILLTFVLAPVADWMERFHVPRVAAAVSMVAVVCVLTLSLSYVVGNQLLQFARDLPEYRDEIVDKIKILQGSGGGLTDTFGKTIESIQKDINDPATAPATTQSTTAPVDAPPKERELSSVTGAGRKLEKAAETTLNETGATMTASTATTRAAALGASPANPVFVSSADTTVMGRLAEYAGIILGPIGTLGLVLVLVLFMLLERDELRDRFIRLTSGGRYTVTTQAITDAADRVGRYLRAQLIVNGTYGVAVAIGLWIIGETLGKGISFPSFILWGVLCAVLRFIPYVGPWVAAAFPLAVSLAVFDGFGVFAATAAMFVTIELISNNFMEPVLYGSSTGISTVALLTAAIVWTSLWGGYGLLLSTPLTVCLVVLGKHVPQLRFLDVLLGDTPALEPGVRFYQRLLAGDRNEATAVVHDYAKEHGTIAAADEVVLPALRLARNDRRDDDLTAQEEVDLYESASHIVTTEREDAAELQEKEALKDEQPPTPVAADDRPLVIGLPAHHRSEVISLQLLAGLLDPLGARVEPLSCSLLPTDIEAQVEAARPSVVFIAVVPPGGVTQARYLCRRLRHRFKDLPIMVGYFGTYRDYDALLVRFRAAGANYVTTSVGQSRTQLTSLLRLKIDPEIALIQSGPPADEAPPTPAREQAASEPSTLCATADVVPSAGGKQ